jgi:hypothetical protein
MPGFDDFSDTGALGFERDRVVDGEIEKRSEDTGRGLDRGCSRLRSDFVKGENAGEVKESSFGTTGSSRGNARVIERRVKRAEEEEEE